MKKAATLRHVVAMMLDSFRDRDLRLGDYRNHVWESHKFLHRIDARRGQALPSTYARAPRAKPRGIVVAMPVRMGMTTFANAIESFLYDYNTTDGEHERSNIEGRAPITINVGTPGNFAEHVHARCLRIRWPQDGTRSGLVESFLSAFDNLFHSKYADHSRNAIFHGKYSIRSMCALAAVSHLGVLIVEQVVYASVKRPVANETWEALALFTTLTGIPVLILTTPGAAAYSLSRLPGASGELAPHGVIEIQPIKSATDPNWISICSIQFDATMGQLGLTNMPEWFPKLAFELTLGYPAVLAKALTSIALYEVSLDTFAFGPEIFTKYANKAIALDLVHLRAVNFIRAGGKATTSNIWEHSDWLTFEDLNSVYAIPNLQ
ncbi:hypothetical protein WCQ02_38820 [Paraburkholderia tropica]|uniref:hypothetical protein n=1 Tax=Paraburkholderia tropica TaxID=92647 RepID=UPI00301B5D5B